MPEVCDLSFTWEINFPLETVKLFLCPSVCLCATTLIPEGRGGGSQTQVTWVDRQSTPCSGLQSITVL